jgi:hypothetical protein
MEGHAFLPRKDDKSNDEESQCHIDSRKTRLSCYSLMVIFRSKYTH